MGKEMRTCLEIAKETSRLTLEGLEFNEALKKAKEIHNIKSLAIDRPVLNKI